MNNLYLQMIFGLLIMVFTILVFIIFQLSKLTSLNYPIEGQEFKILEVDITAYSPSPHITVGDPFQNGIGKFATPKDLEQLRFVAISRDLMEKYGIKYGDKIYIEFEVQDKMGSKVRNGVDIFMRNLRLAKKFGRQKRRVIILKEK